MVVSEEYIGGSGEERVSFYCTHHTHIVEIKIDCNMYHNHVHACMCAYSTYGAL